MAAQGIFGPNERVELVEGEILVMTPQNSRHTTVVHACADELRGAFGSGLSVVFAMKPSSCSLSDDGTRAALGDEVFGHGRIEGSLIDL